jgi:hypothetical protein
MLSFLFLLSTRPIWELCYILVRLIAIHTYTFLSTNEHARKFVFVLPILLLHLKRILCFYLDIHANAQGYVFV